MLVIYHLFYDHGGFIFVPSMEIIDAIYQFTIENLRLGAAKKDLVFFLTVSAAFSTSCIDLPVLGFQNAPRRMAV